MKNPIKNGKEMSIKVYQSDNYNAFKFLKGNRPIKRDHVEALKVAMTNKTFIKPIDINKNGEILDGQHRFTAKKELGHMVEYIIVDDISTADIAGMNNLNAKWVVNDFVESFANQEMPHYVQFKKFWEDFPELSYGICVMLLSGQTYRAKANEDAFKAGEFKVKDLPWATKMAKNLIHMKDYVPKQFNRRNFVLAVMKMTNHPKFDFNILFRKLDQRGGDLDHFAEMNSLYRELCILYNRSNKNKVNFYA